jgi:predicted nuclease of predicted toxin-antitoxin system
MKACLPGSSPKLIDLPGDLFPGSESALRNGLARQGDIRILEYAIAGDFVLVTTDGDFESLAMKNDREHVVILRACNYPTSVAQGVLRRNAIRIADHDGSRTRVLNLVR